MYIIVFTICSVLLCNYRQRTQYKASLIEFRRLIKYPAKAHSNAPSQVDLVQHKQAQMYQVGFRPTISVFERSKLGTPFRWHVLCDQLKYDSPIWLHRNFLCFYVCMFEKSLIPVILCRKYSVTFH